MYADISKIAWPSEYDENLVQCQEDGSVRVTAKDEFGSLILSPHKRDFTVCYLSELSDAKKKCRKKYIGMKKSDAIESKVKEVEIDNAYTVPGLGNTELDKNNSGQVKSVSSQQTRCKTPVTLPTEESLNLSPITQASCANSPEAMSNTSASPVMYENTLKDMGAKFRPFSTPTEGLELNEGTTNICPNCLKPVKERKQLRTQVDNPDGSFLGENCGPGNKNTSDKFTDKEKSLRESVNGGQNICSCANQNIVIIRPDPVGKRIGQEKPQGSCIETLASNHTYQGNTSASSEDSSKDMRRRYTWLTKHVSCDECPTMWSHAVKLAQTLAESGAQVSEKNKGES